MYLLKNIKRAHRRYDQKQGNEEGAVAVCHHQASIAAKTVPAFVCAILSLSNEFRLCGWSVETVAVAKFDVDRSGNGRELVLYYGVS
jgi:hypothetical protein